MNVEIGTEDAQFPEKDYINGIFEAVQLMITNKAKLPTDHQKMLYFLYRIQYIDRRRRINKNNKDESALHIGLTVFGLFEARV